MVLLYLLLVMKLHKVAATIVSLDAIAKISVGSTNHWKKALVFDSLIREAGTQIVKYAIDNDVGTFLAGYKST